MDHFVAPHSRAASDSNAAFYQRLRYMKEPSRSLAGTEAICDEISEFWAYFCGSIQFDTPWLV